MSCKDARFLDVARCRWGRHLGAAVGCRAPEARRCFCADMAGASVILATMPVAQVLAAAVHS
eukprot:1355634-Alexandrium_andersonii.AAC.1